MISFIVLIKINHITGQVMDAGSRKQKEGRKEGKEEKNRKSYV